MKYLTGLAIWLIASMAFGQSKPALLLIGNKSDDTLSFVER